MKDRNIEVSFEQAKDWYKSDNESLRRLALQAYTEEELKQETWETVKTFADACKVLGISPSIELYGVDNEFHLKRHLLALYKLDIIRKALNGDYKPSLIGGIVYYPWLKFYENYDDALEATKKCRDWKLSNSFTYKGTTYYIVCGVYSNIGTNGSGLSNFNYGMGLVSASSGLLCCKSPAVAQHMGKYFAREIFEAIYAQHKMDLVFY